MITDGRGYKEIKKKQQLNSDLLVASLLDRMFREGIINVVTYEKAIKEVKK